MFEDWEVAPFKWKISARAAIWAAVLWAFVGGILTGLLWAGRLPFDLVRIVCVAVLLGGAILWVVAFTGPRNRNVPPTV